jgi:hypothetical protein
VSCPSTTLCVATDDGGGVETSTDPTGGADKWTFASFGVGDEPSAVSCGSTALCVVTDFAGNVVTSKNPTGGTSAWKVTNVDSADPLTAVSCASATQCVAVDEVGNAVTSTNPNGGASAWPVQPDIDSNGGLSGVSCPAVDLCVAVDEAGYVVVGTGSSPPPPPPVKQCVVPKLKGKTLKAAKHSLKSHLCRAGKTKHAKSRTVKKGRVISQKPKPGKRLKQGAKVNLVVSTGKHR